MEDEIKKKAEKEAEKIWKEKLEKDFQKYIGNCLMETLKGLQAELNKFDESMKSHIQTLDSQFEKKFNEKASLIKGQINEVENQNNDEYLANKSNPFFIKDD